MTVTPPLPATIPAATRTETETGATSAAPDLAAPGEITTQPEPTAKPRGARPALAGILPRLRARASQPTMTDEEAERLRAQVGDDPVPLGEDDLACGECGAVVHGPHDTADVYRVPPRIRGPWRESYRHLEGAPFTRCEACLARYAWAEHLAATLLPKGAPVGEVLLMGASAAEAVLATLNALRLMGMPDPQEASLTTPALAEAVRHLAHPGNLLAWRSREFLTDQGNPRPWAHVRASDRLRLRRAYVDMMAVRIARTAPPVKVPPPRAVPSVLQAPDNRAVTRLPGACLMCGIGAVPVPAMRVVRSGGMENVVREVWTERTWESHLLGASRSPRMVIGHLCPECDAAVMYAGALGPSALERAVAVHLRVQGRWDDGRHTLENVHGWAALALRSDGTATTPPPPPNSEPWAHLSGLERVAEALGL